MAGYSSYVDFGLDEAAEALEFINPNLDFKEWSNICRAMAVEYGDEARDIVSSWSSMADNFNSKGFNGLWKSFLKSRSVNISTLIYHARQAGWTPEKQSKITPEEKAKRAAEREQRQQERKAKAEKIVARKQRRTAAFYTALPQLPAKKKPSPYQIDKHLEDAHQYSEFKEFHAKRKKGSRHLMVIPFRDIDENWRGAELIYAWHKTKHHKTGKLRHFRRTIAGTEPSVGFHVFPNHNALKTAKRVFVSEGWAKCCWAHKATGEVMVHGVGAHNLPLIAEIIQQRYPDCEVVLAPDPDKAGNDAIAKHGGLWTQPLIDGDWDDLAITQGPDALKAQLLNIRGFEKCYVDARFLGNSSAAIKPGMNLVKSAKETGKSSWVIDFLNQHLEMSVLVVSYRKNLINQLAKKAGVDYYEDLIKIGDNPNELLRNSRRLAISPDSLYKLLYKGTLEQYDIVFIDECDQTLMHYAAETMKQKEKNLGVMSWLLKHSQYQVLADADLSDMTTEYCRDIIIERGQYIINTHKPRQGSEIHLYGHNMQLRNELKLAAKRGERFFYCSNSKDRVLEVQQLLIDEGIDTSKIQAVHSGNSGTKEIREFIVDINNRVYCLQAVLASPSMGTGVSIDEGNPLDDDFGLFGHPFTKVFAEFTHRTGTAEQAHQQMARARGITEYHVWVDHAVNNRETDPEEIRRIMLDKPEKDSEDLFTFDIHSGEMVAKDPLFEKLYCRIDAFMNLNRNCFAARFIEQAEAEGYTIKAVEFDKDVTLEMEGMTKAIRERLRDELEQRIFDDVNHPILSDKQFKEAELGNLDVSEESRLKTRVVKTLNLDGYLRFPSILAPEKVNTFINQLAFDEATSGYVSGIKKLSVLAQSKEVAILRDIEDRKFAESRTSLKHFTAQRRHELRFLKAVGIDEQLNYDGKEWQSKIIKSSMRAYLKKYKDEIQAYSGSTITHKTLSDPTRWFYDHLRSMNVPLETFQVRVEGKQTWFYRVNPEQWEIVKRLVNARVKGLTKYYTEKQKEFSDATVTREAPIYSNTDCPHVTDESPAIPDNTPSLVHFEERHTTQKTSPVLEIEKPIETPFEQFIHDLDRHKTEVEKQKVAETFPVSHREDFNRGVISKDEMLDWLEYGNSGAFRTAVFNLARALKSIFPKDTHPAKEIFKRLTAAHAKMYCKGQISINELAAIVKSSDFAASG